jgi:hypothetical protein
MLYPIRGAGFTIFNWPWKYGVSPPVNYVILRASNKINIIRKADFAVFSWLVNRPSCILLELGKMFYKNDGLKRLARNFVVIISVFRFTKVSDALHQ